MAQEVCLRQIQKAIPRVSGLEVVYFWEDTDLDHKLQPIKNGAMPCAYGTRLTCVLKKRKVAA